MTATIIRLADHRTLCTRAYAPPIRHFNPPPDPAALAISCLLLASASWWSAGLTFLATEIAKEHRHVR